MANLAPHPLHEGVSKLMDITMHELTMSMSKYISESESYLSTHYRVEGFPMDYGVQSKLAHISWHKIQPQNQMGM